MPVSGTIPSPANTVVETCALAVPLFRSASIDTFYKHDPSNDRSLCFSKLGLLLAAGNTMFGRNSKKVPSVSFSKI